MTDRDEPRHIRDAKITMRFQRGEIDRRTYNNEQDRLYNYPAFERRAALAVAIASEKAKLVANMEALFVKLPAWLQSMIRWVMS